MVRCLAFMALLASMLFTVQVNADQISEVLGNPPGTDPATQEVELLGTANAAFDLWIISIESDLQTPAQGVVDRGENVTGTYDADGRAVVVIDDLENPSFTLVLCEEFTGIVGTTDFDTDDDGTIDDASTIVGFMDAIGILEDVGDPEFGAQLGGIDLTPNGNSSDPLIVFRDETTGTWYSVDPDLMVYDASGAVVTAAFNLDPTVSTFGSANPTLGGSPILLGDANCDGEVSFLDITPFIALISNGEFKAEADVDMSGEVDFLDIVPFIAILSAP